MSVTVNVDKKQGSTMGTVIAKVTDAHAEVRDVYFYVKVGSSAEMGPYPPDILRRPDPGVYEKDIVLDSVFETSVETRAILHDGTVVLGTAQIFGVRTPTAGTTGEVNVQDADTGATAARALVFQGAVVSVASGVATFDLDGRYSQATHLHDGRYAQLAGAEFTGRVVSQQNLGATGMQYHNAQLEVRSTDASAAGIGFHRLGHTALTLRHLDGGVLDLYDSGGTWSRYRGGSFFAMGNNGRHLKLGGENVAGEAQVITTDGNLHLDPSDGTHGTYLNWFRGDRVVIGNGASAQRAQFNANGLYLNDGWLRTYGGGGWLSETYQGGWHMTDPTWIRGYNGKSLWMGAGVIGTDGSITVGYGGGTDAAYRLRVNGSGHVSGTLAANRIRANAQGSNAAGGVSLYMDKDHYGIFFRGTSLGSAWGNHGYTSGDWATYLTMDNSAGRGWIFRNTAVGNVASIRNDGYAAFNGPTSAHVGGSTAGGHGHPTLFMDNHWGLTSTVYPTLGGNVDVGATGKWNGLVMLLRPHVPFVPGYGALVRMASASTSPLHWDAGLNGDQYLVARAGVTAFRIDNTGALFGKNDSRIQATHFGSTYPDASTPGNVGDLWVVV